MFRIFIFAFSFFIVSFNFYSQADSLRQDSVKPKKNKAVYSNARKATIMSALVPGLGQIYNKKYWKVPIIYAGLGGFGYMFYENNIKYKYYRSALLLSVDNGGFAVADNINYSTEDLQKLKLNYKKYRDFAVMGIGIFYLLNLIDANVDAHLKTFDVSDNLSMNINPWQTISSGGRWAAGLSIKLNFK